MARSSNQYAFFASKSQIFMSFLWMQCSIFFKKAINFVAEFFSHIFQSYAIKMSMYWVFSSLSKWNATENILLNSINKIVAVEKDTCALNESESHFNFVLLVSVVRILGRNVNFHNYFFPIHLSAMQLLMFRPLWMVTEYRH